MDATPSMTRLSLVIPAFNEEQVIKQAVGEAVEALSRLFSDYEVLVVDDGSTDRTAVRVESLAGTFARVRLLRHPVNRGYGAALRTGFEAARFPLVGFTDADCQFDLTELGKLITAMHDVPIAVGYRADRKDLARRRFLSYGYNLITRILLGTGVRDCDCALKVFRRDVLADLLPQSRGFFANAEMLTRARQNRYDVAEVPVTHRPRAGGQSKVSLAEVPRTLGVLLPFWWRNVVLRWPSPRPNLITARIEGVSSTPRPVPVLPLASGHGLRVGLPGPRQESI